jgi:hypothetical protein
MSTAWLDGPRQGVPWRGFRYPAGLVDEDHHDTIHQLVPFELWQRAQHLHWFRRPTRPPPDVAREHPPRASAFFMFAPLAGNLATELPPTSRRCGNVFGAYIASAIRHQRSKPAGAKANKFSAWPTQADAIRASRISGASLHGVRGTDISLSACAGLGRG